MQIGVGVLRVVHVAIVVDGQNDFAGHPIAVEADEFTRRLGQPGKLLRRKNAVEAVNEAPDPGALADEFVGENAKPVNRAFAEIGFNQQHGSLLRVAASGPRPRASGGAVSMRSWMDGPRRRGRMSGMGCALRHVRAGSPDENAAKQAR